MGANGGPICHRFFLGGETILGYDLIEWDHSGTIWDPKNNAGYVKGGQNPLFRGLLGPIFTLGLGNLDSVSRSTKPQLSPPRFCPRAIFLLPIPLKLIMLVITTL